MTSNYRNVELAAVVQELGTGHAVLGRGCRSTALRDEVDRFASTTQTDELLVFFLGKSISVLRHEMGSYFLWAAPCGMAEGTLALLFVLVPRVPS